MFRSIIPFSFNPGWRRTPTQRSDTNRIILHHADGMLTAGEVHEDIEKRRLTRYTGRYIKSGCGRSLPE